MTASVIKYLERGGGEIIIIIKKKMGEGERGRTPPLSNTPLPPCIKVGIPIPLDMQICLLYSVKKKKKNLISPPFYN